ncbi:MAG: hypothetical protein ACTSR8_06815 [Promethearchaeota archaeon]
MGKPKKKGTYEHLCLLIFAQGKWTEKDKMSVRQPLLDKRKDKPDFPYPFFLKFTRQEKKPSDSYCNICGSIYEMFQEIIGPNDNIFYQGHHYIILEDDKEDMKELPSLILPHSKVKKLYFLYLDSFKEFDRNEVKKWTLNDLKEHVTSKQCNASEFENLVDHDEFKPRILYEITKY